MSMQSDFRRLLSEQSDDIAFAITDQKLDDMFNAAFKDKVDYLGEYYALSPDHFEDFEEFVHNNGFDMNQDVDIVQEVEEMSVTGGGEAYLPGLDVPAKKYKYGYTKDLKEDVNCGYKTVKGFRPGHTKDTGGFQYKDLWNVNEREETSHGDFKIGDKVEIINMWPDKSYGEVVSFDDDLVAVNVNKGGGSTFTRQMMIPHDKLRLQSSEIAKQKKKEKKKEKEKEKKEMEKEPIKEGLKTEIKVRSKKQQFQEATKLANKKLKEINNILEYASNLKSDLNETEYSSSSKAMESMKKSIAEAYKKMKSL